MPVVGSLRAARYVGQAGKDTYFGTNEDDWITGGSGDDLLAGGDGADLIDGGSDNDRISGDAGADQLFGGSGDDREYGGVGDDQVDGGSGNDALYGGSGKDTLLGRSEADTLDGGAGDDVVYGGSGDDTLVWHSAENIGAHDTLFGGDGNDLLQLDLSAAQWTSPAFQSEYAAFLTWIAGPAGSAGENGPRFVFNSLGGLTVAGTNRVEVTVDGAPAVPLDQPVVTHNDSVSVSEDGPSATGNVLGNDTVADGVGSVELLTDTSHGTLVFNPDGSFAYTPGAALQTLGAGQSAVDSFTYRVTDTDGDSNTATVSITITGANDAPLAQAIDGGIGEDGAVQLIPSFSDIDKGDTHAVTVGTMGTRGQVTVNGDGTLRYDAGGHFDDLAAGQTATDSFTYTVTDNHGGTATATATVTVTGANDGPSADNIFVEATEDGPASTLIPAFVDPDTGDTYISSIDTTGTHGTTTVNGDGTFNYDAAGQFDYLAAGETAIDGFTYTITDSQGATSTAIATVTVIGQNDGPTIGAADLAGAVTRLPDNAPGAGIATLNAGGQIGFTDVDFSDAHIVSVAPLGSGYRGDFNTSLTQDSTGGAAGAIGWSFTVNDGALADLQPGLPLTQDYAVTIDDGHGGTLTRTVTITLQGGNTAPEAFDMAATVDEDGPAATAVPFFFDPDPGDSFTVSLNTTGTQGAVSINPDGTFTYDPTGRFESLAVGDTAVDIFTFTITDAAGGSSTATAEVTVVGQNDGPVAQAITATSDEDGGTTLLPAFVDPDTGDTHTITVDLTGARGTVTVNPDGTVAYSAAGHFDELVAGQTAIDTFSYTVTDSQGVASTATASVTVFGANDDVVLNPINVTISEDGPALPLIADFFDPDGSGNYSFGVDTAPAHGVITMTGGFGMTYDTAGQFERLGTGQTATDTFRYIIAETGGGVHLETVTVTIEGRNDAPVAQGIDGSVANNAPPIALAPVFSDVDLGDAHSISIDTTGTRGIVSLNADGTFGYSANGQFSGLPTGDTATDSFTYTVTDSQGATSTATATITVVGANTVPVAQPLTATVGEDGPAITLNADFVDPDPGDHHSIGVDSGPAHGVITITGDTSFTYDPSGQFDYLRAGETASDDFSYLIADAQGAVSTASVTITVVGVNDGPVAQSLAAITDEDGPAATFAPVFTDADRDDTHTVTIDAATAAGLVTLNPDGTITYDPGSQFDALTTGQSVVDTFTYTVTDSEGATSTASVSVTVFGQNDAPVAFDLDGSVDEDGPSLTLLPAFTDPDAGEVFSIDVDTSATIGLVTINPDGTLQYDSNGQFENLGSGETAVDIFTYTITDSQGVASTATARVIITGTFDTPSGPLFSDASDSVDFNATLAFNYTGSPYDALGGDDSVTLAATDFAANRAGFVPGTPFHGGDGNDVVVARGAFADVIDGDAGDDTLDGSEGTGADVLFGGTGNDALSSGGAFATLYGGDGMDSLSGKSGATLYGEADNDVLEVTAAVGYGGLGDDIMVGNGFGLLMGEDGDDIMYGLAGDVVFGGAGADEMYGDAGARLRGDGGDDYLIVAGTSEAEGGDGADTLYGGAQSTLFGESGDDTLYVVSGSQTAIGGDGTDTAIFTDVSDTVAGVSAVDVERIELAGGDDFYRTDSPTGAYGPVVHLDQFTGNDGTRLALSAPAGSWLGYAVSGAGDVNGDGYADIVVGAPLHDNGSGSGAAYVMFGHAGGFGSLVDLANVDGSTGFRIVGSPDGELGSAVAAGDVNGDGYGDMLIGAPLEDGQTGAAYLVFGHAGGFGATVDVSALNGTNGVALTGAFAGALSGLSVAVGDINGDGYDDMLVGAPLGDGLLGGAAYVVYGAAGGFGPTINLGALDGTNGFRIDGPQAGDQAGYAVAAIGDINGDGIGDMAIGAPTQFFGQPGDVYVVYGSTSPQGPTLGLGSLDGGNGFHVHGDLGDGIGVSVSAAGDINGDGIGDLLIGAPGTDHAYVVFGTDAPMPSLLELSSLDGGNGFEIVDGTGSFTGFSVSAAGDVDGDGDDDLLVGAPGVSAGSLEGSAYVVFGSPHGLAATVDLSSLDGSDGVRLQGPLPGTDAQNAGWSVAGAGDVDGDGIDDVVVGAYSVDNLNGAAYLVLGRGETGVNVYGGAGDDTLYGRGGTDTLSGDIGDDVIVGAAGGDTLFGGDGDDRIQGGTGDDLLYGGINADIFQITPGGGHDTIADFQDGTDVIDATALGIGFDDISVTDTAGGALVQLGAGGPSLLLHNVTASTVDTGDFLLVGIGA